MLKKTERTKIARKPDRGRYDRETVHAIMDEALYCHVGIVALMLDEASAKVPAGPPADDEADYAHPVWAGGAPVAERLGDPVPDPRLAPGIALPAYLGRLAEAKG